MAKPDVCECCQHLRWKHIGDDIKPHCAAQDYIELRSECRDIEEGGYDVQPVPNESCPGPDSPPDNRLRVDDIAELRDAYPIHLHRAPTQGAGEKAMLQELRCLREKCQEQAARIAELELELHGPRER